MIKTKEKKVKQNKKKTKKDNDENKFNFNEEMVIGLKKTSKKETAKKTSNDKKKQDRIKKEKKKNQKIKNKRKKEDNKGIIFIKKYIKYVAVIIFLFVIIVFLMLSPLFNITKIEVKGNDKISSEYIVHLSEILVNENTFKMNKKNAIKKIKTEPYIESIIVTRNLPSTVEISVVERQATYMLEFANSFAYINNQGYILEISQEKIEVPIIIGYKTSTEEIATGKRLIETDLYHLEKILKVIEVAKNNEINSYITKIDISSNLDMKLILEGEGKVVYLGDCTNINTRMQYLKVIIEQQKGKNGEVFINGDMNNSSAIFREGV